MDNEFEKAANHRPLPGAAGQAMIQVADTAYMCRLWLASYGRDWNDADVMAMTEMVLKREREIVEDVRAVRDGP